MKVQEFRAVKIDLLLEFSDFWARQREAEGVEDWPDEMDEVEWEEQFILWEQTRETAE